MGVVHVIVCSCSSFSVEKIKPVQKQFQKHIYDIGTYHLKAPLARHVSAAQQEPSMSQMLGLGGDPSRQKGGDFDPLVLQHETRWIWELEATKAPSLNGSLSFVPFLRYIWDIIFFNFLDY